MKYTRIFPLILILTACAPVQAAAPMVTAETSTPITAPTVAPTATSTSEPTATPFPIPEGAVKAADGSTVYVKEGKLWQLDAQGQAVEKDILDVTFANVLDGSGMVRQLHPEYYENDQKLLRETLLPKGVSFHPMYKAEVDGFATATYTEFGTQALPSEWGRIGYDESAKWWQEHSCFKHCINRTE